MENKQPNPYTGIWKDFEIKHFKVPKVPLEKRQEQNLANLETNLKKHIEQGWIFKE